MKRRDLARRVKIDVVGEAVSALDLASVVGRRVDVHLLAELLAPEPRLLLAPRGGAVERFAHQRKAAGIAHDLVASRILAPVSRLMRAAVAMLRSSAAASRT